MKAKTRVTANGLIESQIFPWACKDNFCGCNQIKLAHDKGGWLFQVSSQRKPQLVAVIFTTRSIVVCLNQISFFLFSFFFVDVPSFISTCSFHDRRLSKSRPFCIMLLYAKCLVLLIGEWSRTTHSIFITAQCNIV